MRTSCGEEERVNPAGGRHPSCWLKSVYRDEAQVHPVVGAVHHLGVFLYGPWDQLIESGNTDTNSQRCTPEHERCFHCLTSKSITVAALCNNRSTTQNGTNPSGPWPATDFISTGLPSPTHSMVTARWRKTGKFCLPAPSMGFSVSYIQLFVYQFRPIHPRILHIPQTREGHSMPTPLNFAQVCVCYTPTSRPAQT